MNSVRQMTRVDEALEIAQQARLPKLLQRALVGLALAGAIVTGSLASGHAEVAAKFGLLTAAVAVMATLGATLRARRLTSATEVLASLARADADSGLLAPHALRTDLSRLLDHSRAMKHPLAIVMVTIDELRALHLERGLAAGRLLERQVAQAIEATAASHGGRCYRAHGTAFVALLPGATHAEGERVAQKLAPVLHLLERKHGDLVDLNAGAAVALGGDLAEDLVQRAERRCQRLRAGLLDDAAQVLRPLSTH